MRATNGLELSIISGKRTWRQKILLKLFWRDVYHITYKHLSRAREVSELDSKAFHSLAYYLELDCMGKTNFTNERHS